MKIQVVSDLHHEFGIGEIRYDKSDIVIIAGDLNVGIKGIEWIKENIKGREVIYVLGNHEYYKGSYPKTLNKIKDLSNETKIHVLENKSIEIEGVNFHGCTLWTDFSIFGNPIEYGMICQSKMNDYRQIRKDPSYSKLRTIDTFNIHQESTKWLKESLIRSESKIDIVVTHHAPSMKSIKEDERTNPLTTAYASNLEEMIKKHEPDYWIHGHIHTPIRYKIGKTEIICNPHGYIDEKYNGFEKDLIIEV